MNITSEMLFFRLSQNYTLRTQHIGVPGVPVRGIRIWKNQESMEDSILYLAETPGSFSKKKKEQPKLCLFTKPFEEHDFVLSEKMVWACPEQEVTPETLHIVLLEVYNELLRWDCMFTEALVNHSDYRKLMSMGQNMLPWEYIISTWDLKCAYQTPRSNIPMDDSARQMMVEKLLMEPQYHAAAHFTESFYYYDETNICQTLCGNICPDGRFLGRIIMIIGKKGTTVPDGARELFERFTLYMEQLISFHYSTFGDFARNQIHDLFQHIVNGRQADSAVQADVLKKLGWKDTDLYMVLTIQFFDDARWNTHLETTLPYLIHKLENIYPDSCAVRKDSALCWLVNRSRSGTEDDSYGFRQTLVSFLRENACSAGISAEFHDISLAFYALKEAETAYLIGKRKNPQFWYFSFDDYSMDYMIGRLQEEFPTFMLVHPAVRTLMAYDAKNNAEYTATLREYLQCGLNMTAAAEKLFIHRTTFCRRMSRIEQLTELDLQEPDTILSLLLSFRLLSN